MRNRARMTAAAVAVAAVLAAGGGAAVASAGGGKPGAQAAKSASAKAMRSKAAEERHGHNEMIVAVARELHLSTAGVAAALAPLFASGHADPSSPAFVAAARSLGVSTKQLTAALVHAKQSLAATMGGTKSTGGSKAAGSKAPGSKVSGSKVSGSKAPGSTAAGERRGHDMITAAVASALHVSIGRVDAALRPIFAAGYADPRSPVFAAAAHALGVSTQQLAAALTHAKESLAGS